jgi:hypothetical protein
MYTVPVLPPRGFGMRTEIEGFVFPAILNDSLHDASNNNLNIVVNFPLDISDI